MPELSCENKAVTSLDYQATVVPLRYHVEVEAAQIIPWKWQNLPMYSGSVAKGISRMGAFAGLYDQAIEKLVGSGSQILSWG